MQGPPDAGLERLARELTAADQWPPAAATVRRWPARTRRSAVLALFVTDETSADDGQVRLVLTERAGTLRAHAGQISFPGGGADGDETPAQTALREAFEEVALPPDQVQVLGMLAPDALTSAFNTAVVVGRWSGVGELVARPAEVAQVLQYPISMLVDPAVRVSVRHPRGGQGPAFALPDQMMVWGFTAALVDRLLQAGGWATAWDQRRFVPVPARFLGGVSARVEPEPE